MTFLGHYATLIKIPSFDVRSAFGLAEMFLQATFLQIAGRL